MQKGGVRQQWRFMPFLSSCSFYKLFNDQRVPLPVISLETIGMGLPLMLPVAQGALPPTESLSCSHLFLLVPEERWRFLGWKVWNVLLWKKVGKRWRICKRLRDSRAQLSRGMTKVEKRTFGQKFTNASQFALPEAHPFALISISLFFHSASLAATKPCSSTASAEIFLL